MPQRFLRPEITNSERFNSVGFPAQSLFIRLLTVVDDWGRCDGRPALILTHCFTVWNMLHMEQESAVNLQQLAQMLQELAAKSLIEIYYDPVEHRSVLQIQQWRERLRAGVKEKWPAKKQGFRVLYGSDEKLQQVSDELQQPALDENLQQPAQNLQQPAQKLQQPAQKLQAPSPSTIALNQLPAPSPCSSQQSAEKLQQVSGELQQPAQKLLQNPASRDLIVEPSEAKRLICEKILVGRSADRPWSYAAESGLSRLCKPPGLPRIEIERIGWWRRLAKSDEVPELRDRRDPITETTLIEYWGDEYSRAEAYWRKVKSIGANGSGKKKKWPARAKEWLLWKYPELNWVPEEFEELPADVRNEWAREHEDWERATPLSAKKEEAIA